MCRDEQLGRRFVHVHLSRNVDWQRSLQQQAPQHGIEGWRAASRNHAAAADAIVSGVIDDFFSGETSPVFEDIAKALGFSLLNQGDDSGRDFSDELSALFEACCSAEAVVASTCTWKGRGWRLVRRNETDPVSKVWRAVCDNTGKGFTSSRRAQEVDWAGQLKHPVPIECDLLPNGGSTLALRFRCGKSRSPSLKVNEEIGALGAPAITTEEASSVSPSGEAPGLLPDTLESPAAGPALMVVSAPPDTPFPIANEALPADPAPIKAAVSTTALIFVAVETRSTCDRKRERGRQYAAHLSTEILTVAALVDGRLVAWAPQRDAPLPVESLWPEAIGPAQPIDSFAGPNLPAPLAEAIVSGRPLCAHDSHDVVSRLW